MTTTTATSRISAEIQEFMRFAKEESDQTMKLILCDDNLTHFKAEIAGPLDTPYEGGKFKLDIKIPRQYPFVPPKVKFLTRVWHPNIYSMTGKICLDILSDQWVATMSLRTVFLSIQALLSTPEPNDPQDAGVASQYLSNPEMFKQTAQHWTYVYAGGPYYNEEFNDKISRILETGLLDEQRTREALSYSSWSMQQAMDTIYRIHANTAFEMAPRLASHHQPSRQPRQPRTVDTTFTERIVRARPYVPYARRQIRHPRTIENTMVTERMRRTNRRSYVRLQTLTPGQLRTLQRHSLDSESS